MSQVNFRRTSFVVLDEADDLLTSLEEPTTLILKRVRDDAQISCFASSWSEDLRAKANKILGR